MAKNNKSEIFDPEFLSRLRKLFFKLRKRKQLKKKGAQATPAAGFTREFKDHRAYTPGDDFRAIDWGLFARLEKIFIRIFEEVQEFHIHIVLDRSTSMIEPYDEKRITALRLVVALTYLGLVNDHRVSVFSMAGGGVRREFYPLKGQGHIHSVLKRMEEIEFNGETDLTGSLKQFRPGRGRRGIVFLLSDLYGKTIESAREAVVRSSSWPSETHVLHIVHPEEREPGLSGEFQLECVETNELRRIWLTKREMAQYTKGFDNYLEDLRKTCMKRQLNYVTWLTDQPFEDMFVNLLSRGSALAGA